jgi:hypothetical protein
MAAPNLVAFPSGGPLGEGGGSSTAMVDNSFNRGFSGFNDVTPLTDVEAADAADRVASVLADEAAVAADEATVAGLEVLEGTEALAGPPGWIADVVTGVVLLSAIAALAIAIEKEAIDLAKEPPSVSSGVKVPRPPPGVVRPKVFDKVAPYSRPAFEGQYPFTLRKRRK